MSNEPVTKSVMFGGHCVLKDCVIKDVVQADFVVSLPEGAQLTPHQETMLEFLAKNTPPHEMAIFEDENNVTLENTSIPSVKKIDGIHVEYRPRK